MTLPPIDTLFPKSFQLKTTPILVSPKFPELLENHPKFPASDRFVRQIEAELSRLSPSLLKRLIDTGCKVKVGRQVIEIMPRLRILPWQKDQRTWAHVEGLAMPDKHFVVAAEFVWNKLSRHQTPSGAKGEWQEVRNSLRDGVTIVPATTDRPCDELEQVTRPQYVFRHELGHLLDKVLNLDEGTLLSADPDFRIRHRADCDELTQDQQSTWDFFIRPGKRTKPSAEAACEVFAEAYAALAGGGCMKPKVFQRTFPRSTAFVKNCLTQLS